MRSWLAKVIYFLPLTPWGRRPGGGGGDGEAPADLQLEIVLLELLSKGRLLYCLYEDEVEGGGPRASARNSVLPPTRRPVGVPVPSQARAGGGRSRVALGGAAAARARPARGDPRDVPAARAPQRRGHRRALPRRRRRAARRAMGDERARPQRRRRRRRRRCRGGWRCPRAYAEGLALAVLGALGGPGSRRHPPAGGARRRRRGGGDRRRARCGAPRHHRASGRRRDVWRGRNGREGAAAPSHAGGADAAAKRARALVEQARFWGEGGSAAAGLLVVEEVASGVRLPRDGRKGWFDPTQRAYVVAAAGEGERARRRVPLPVAAAQRGGGEQRACSARARGGAPRDGVGRIDGARRLRAPPPPRRRPRLAAPPAAARADHSLPERRRTDAPPRRPRPPRRHHFSRRRPRLEALRVATYEFFGRPFAPNCTLWPEHPPLLLALTAKPYREAHGAPVARLVQRRLLRDVVARDFLAVAANALRGADAAVVGVQLALEASPYNGVAAVGAPAAAGGAPDGAERRAARRRGRRQQAVDRRARGALGSVRVLWEWVCRLSNNQSWLGWAGARQRPGHPRRSAGSSAPTLTESSQSRRSFPTSPAPVDRARAPPRSTLVGASSRRRGPRPCRRRARASTATPPCTCGRRQCRT